MPKSGIKRARKYWRYRKNVSSVSEANASGISSRGIALTDVDLAMVIGGSNERSEARAQMEVGTVQPLGCCCNGPQAENQLTFMAKGSSTNRGKVLFL